MHILVHIYAAFMIFFYIFIVIIRFWDDFFGESADTSQTDGAIRLTKTPMTAMPGFSRASGLYQQSFDGAARPYSR
jgi:hypothetical protein